MIDDCQQRHFSPMPPTRHPRKPPAPVVIVEATHSDNCRDKPTKPVKRVLPAWWEIAF